MVWYIPTCADDQDLVVVEAVGEVAIAVGFRVHGAALHSVSWLSCSDTDGPGRGRKQCVVVPLVQAVC